MTLTIVVGVRIWGRIVKSGPIVAHEVIAIADETARAEATAKSGVEVIDASVNNADACAIAGVCRGWNVSMGGGGGGDMYTLGPYVQPRA